MNGGNIGLNNKIMEFLSGFKNKRTLGISYMDLDREW